MNYNEGSSAKGFCKFVTDQILPNFTPGRNQGANTLFRFVILLLPVDGNADLNSESYVAFRKLLTLHTEYAIDLLKESLQYKPTRHRPYVWRLLASAAAPMSLIEPFRNAAENEQLKAETTDPLLHREVSRFLHKFSPVEPSPIS